MLEEQVIAAFAEDDAVRIVHPSGARSEVDEWSQARAGRHPLTPLEAMLPMNERWKARNSASTGRVIRVE
jgi:hypothetical protein